VRACRLNRRALERACGYDMRALERACKVDRRACVHAYMVNRCACVRACGGKNRALGARFQGEKVALFDVLDNCLI
jgi:ribosomal protein L16/L10AE